jgi:hypothetical protein
LLCRECIERKTGFLGWSWNPITMFKKCTRPVVELGVAILKKRKDGRRNLILIQVSTC